MKYSYDTWAALDNAKKALEKTLAESPDLEDAKKALDLVKGAMDIVSDDRMRLDENAKITLTLGQIKRLVKEAKK